MQNLCLRLFGFSIMSAQGGDVAQGWKQHVAARNSQDFDQMVANYADDAVITMHNMSSGKSIIYKGGKGIARYVNEVLRGSKETNVTRTVVDVIEKNGLEPGNVFEVQGTPKSGCAEATSTYIYNDAIKIVDQTVVMACSTVHMPTGKHNKPRQMIIHGQGAAAKTWLNYFKAFGRQRVDRILQDYTVDSSVVVYNTATKTKQVCEGLGEIRHCFVNLFETLSDVGDLAAPVQVVTSSPDVIFAVWHAASSGYKSATDTYILDSDGKGKILRHNLVVHYLPPVPTAADIPILPVPRRRFSYSGMLTHSVIFGLGCWAARAVAHTVYDDMDEKH